jgi:hypothetical protein
LDIFRYSVREMTTVAVADSETVDTAEVEYHEGAKRRGIGAHVAHVMAKLYNEAESGEGGLLEKLPVPLLGCT